MALLYLIRHGQGSFGGDDYDRLSPLGYTQARETGRFLRSSGASFDAAYCGTLARQQKTAQEVLEQLNDPPRLEIRPRWNEYDSQGIIQALAPTLAEQGPTLARALPGIFTDRASFQLVYETAMRLWVKGAARAGSLESWAAFRRRVDCGLEEIRAGDPSGKKILIFTSGGPISAAVRAALGLDDMVALELTWLIKNASITSFLLDRTRFSLNTFNCTAHLESSGRPDLITFR